MPKGDWATFRVTDLKGSKLRCLMLTTGSEPQVSVRLSKLVERYGRVVAGIHHWMPRGFLDPNESQLGKTRDFLSGTQREKLRSWWLAQRRGVQTPHWDVASGVTLNDGGEGMLLVEAKAHRDELIVNDSCRSQDDKNKGRIAEALEAASSGLNEILPGWALSPDTHYELCNRFAWSWKLASLGVPVLLVYLGFLGAGEMPSQLTAAADWRDAVLEYSDGIVPTEVWSELAIPTERAPFRALIRAVDVKFEVSKPGGGAA